MYYHDVNRTTRRIHDVDRNSNLNFITWHNLEIAKIYELLDTGPEGLKLKAVEERLF